MKQFFAILFFIVLTTTASFGQEINAKETPQRILRLYPNPAISFIKFDFQNEYQKGYSIQIINFIGKQQQDLKNINYSTTLDLSNFSRGIYIYQLKNENGKIVDSGKFQVRK